MKALILAAGEGSRLRPLTDRTPKPMLEIAGKPILEHNVLLAAKYGICDIAINLHHRSEVIANHFGDGSRFGVRVRYSRERELLGTAGALNSFREFFIEESFAVIYGDNLSTCDLSRLIARHKAASAAATIAVFHREDPSASGIVEFDNAGYVTRFLEKPKETEIFSKWVNAGLLVLEPSVLDAIPLEGSSDFGRDTLPKLLRLGHSVAAYPMTENLWWIDSQSDYENTLRTFPSLERRR